MKTRGGLLLSLVLVVLCCCYWVNAQSGPVIITQSDIQSLVDLHNQVRTAANISSSGQGGSLPNPGANLRTITWDSALTNIWAQSYASNCVFRHTDSDYRSSAGGKSGGYVGENIAWSSNYRTVANMFILWYNEHKDYYYHPVASGDFGQGVPQTGHYTQLIWGNTFSIGCSYNNCTGTSGGGYLLACNYYTGGNYMGQYPYTQTAASSPTKTPTQSPTSVASDSSTSSTSLSTTSTASLSSTSTTSQTPSNSVSTAPSSSSTPSLIPLSSDATLTASASISVSESQSSAPSFSSSNYPSASQSPAPSCAPSTCSSLGAVCGSYDDQCGGTLNCGPCAAGSTCTLGRCEPNVCSPACTGTQVCNNLTSLCICAPGYTLNPITLVCQNLAATSPNYPLVPFVGAIPNVWVVQPNQPPELPQMNNVDSSLVSVRRSILWQNSDSFCSDSNTTVTAQFYTGSGVTVSFGIGIRLGQAPPPASDTPLASLSPRTNDSIEWRFDVSNGQIKGTYIMWYYGGYNNMATSNSVAWPASTWNTITVRTVQDKNNNLFHTIIINGQALLINGYNSIGVNKQYYPFTGQVYFSGYGQFGLRTITISTATTMTVSIAGCMSPEAWANFVAGILGTGVTVVQSSVNSACSSKKRAAAGSSVFTFALSDGPLGQSSSGYASKFLNLAAKNDPSFASRGISVQTAAVQPAAANPVTAGYLVGAPAAPAAAVAGAGIGVGAIIAIAVGGGVAAVAGVGIVTAAVVAVVIVVVVRKSRRSDYKNEVQMEPVHDEETASPKKREGVDIFDPQDRRQSVTGRSKVARIN